MKKVAQLDEGLSEVLAGIIHLILLVATPSFHARLLYTYSIWEMLFPCPKSIPVTDKLLKNFSLSVWLTVGLVLLLTTAVFWCAGNGPYRPLYNETHTYQSLSYSFQNAWAVFVGVGVPQQPTTSRHRIFFLLYVCFCFAISTVFQALFVSYLLGLKYEKKIETLDELLLSDVLLGYNQAFLQAKDTVTYPEIVKFFDQRTQKEECRGRHICVERMIKKRYGYT